MKCYTCDVDLDTLDEIDTSVEDVYDRFEPVYILQRFFCSRDCNIAGTFLRKDSEENCRKVFYEDIKKAKQVQ